MIPHYLVNKKMVPWPADKANILYQQFRTEIITQLRKQDMANGVPANGQVYEEIKGDKKNPDVITGYKIDHVLSRHAHSGADTNNLLKKRWYDYCIVPHEVPDDLIVPIPEPTYKPSIRDGNPGKVSSKNAVAIQEPGVLQPVNVPDMIASGEKERAKKSKRDLKG